MQSLSRRGFLMSASAATAGLALSENNLFADEVKKFTLPKLPYDYNALEPSIDAETMKLHHDFHHKAYVDNLNAALKDHPEFFKKTPVEIVSNIKAVPEKIRQAVINNGGGDVNHTLFWEIMGPKTGGAPTGDLGKAIDSAFGTFDKFQTQLTEAAMKQFGSGWAWLVLNKGKLEVLSTANQDSPYMDGMFPIMGLDVWEHAYYLKYKNKRADYVKAWWNVVNWKNVADRHASAKKRS